jgi:hypothetical protein
VTWYAGHIFAEPSDAVIRELLAFQALAGHMYHVSDLGGHVWHDPEVLHGLPAGGLLVARELCAFASPEGEWHGEEAVQWDGRVASFTVGPTVIGPSDLNVIVPPYLDEEGHSLADTFPPIEFLRFLKSVSQSTRTTVSYFHCSMWGGTTEAAYGFVYGAEDVVFVHRTDGTSTEYRAFGERERQDDVLRLVLQLHDLRLPTPYFALHARSFPWSRYRLR